MFQKIKNRIRNMNELTKTRLFAGCVLVVMLSCFLVLHKNKTNDNNFNYNQYRYLRV